MLLSINSFQITRFKNVIKIIFHISLRIVDTYKDSINFVSYPLVHVSYFVYISTNFISLNFKGTL